MCARRERPGMRRRETQVNQDSDELSWISLRFLHHSGRRLMKEQLFRGRIEMPCRWLLVGEQSPISRNHQPSGRLCGRSHSLEIKANALTHHVNEIFSCYNQMRLGYPAPPLNRSPACPFFFPFGNGCLLRSSRCSPRAGLPGSSGTRSSTSHYQAMSGAWSAVSRRSRFGIC